jgi:hypothetical protein
VFRDPADPPGIWWRAAEIHTADDETHITIVGATCERCQRAPIDDDDAGLCTACVQHNNTRVTI